MITPSTGFHPTVTYETYSAWDAANISRLKAMSRSPLHCKHAIENPREQTDSLLMGLALHAAVFEPAKFETGFAVIPKFDRRTKDGKAAHEQAMNAAAGKDIINEEQLEAVTAMADSIRETRSAQKFLVAPGMCEHSALWLDTETQMRCKGRFDKLAQFAARPVIVELKTTKDAGSASFGRDVFNYGYAAQAAFYCDGHKAVTGEEPLHVIIAVENSAPWAVACYMLTDAALQTGRLEYRRWLNLYADCVRSGVWPGYPDKVELLDLPAWAARSVEPAE